MIFIVDECVLYLKKIITDPFQKKGWSIKTFPSGLSDLDIYRKSKAESIDYIITNNIDDFKKIANPFEYAVKLVAIQKPRDSATIISCIEQGIIDNKNVISIGYYANLLSAKKRG